MPARQQPFERGGTRAFACGGRSARMMQLMRACSRFFSDGSADQTRHSTVCRNNDDNPNSVFPRETF